MTKKATIKTIGSGYQSSATLDENFSAINDKLENTISRDGSTPNDMGADLDLSNNDVLNAKTVNAKALLLNGVSATVGSLVATPPASSITFDDTLAAFTATNVQDALELVAPLANPTFTGTVNVSSTTLTLADDQIAGAKVAVATDTTRGTVEKSASAENTGGTATDVYPDVAGVKEMIDTFVPTPGTKLLASATASNDATIELTAFDATNYSSYIVVLSNVIPSTDSTGFSLRTSSDGGSTFDSGSTDYTWYNRRQTHESVPVSTETGSSGSGSIRLAEAFNIGSDVGEYGYSAVFTIHRPGESLSTHITWEGIYEDAGGLVRMIEGSATRVSAGAVDAMQFFFGSGNVESGFFELYGMRKS